MFYCPKPEADPVLSALMIWNALPQLIFTIVLQKKNSSTSTNEAERISCYSKLVTQKDEAKWNQNFQRTARDLYLKF